jgi:predicted extracellular nuclease
MAVLYKKDIDGVKCESVSLGDLHIPSIHENGDTDALAPISQRRDILSFDFDYQGKKLRAVTFHLKSLHPEYLEGEDKENDRKAHADAKFRCIFYKMMEMRALRTYADKSLDEGRHVIFLGDFNENNNASSMDILKSSNKEEAMLYDVLVGYEGNRTTHIHRGNSLTFDTAVVSAGIKDMIASVSIENSNLKDWSVPPPGKLEFEVQGTESDHALVWVILK